MKKEALIGGLSRMLRDVQRSLGGSAFGVCEDCSLFSAENTPTAAIYAASLANP